MSDKKSFLLDGLARAATKMLQNNRKLSEASWHAQPGFIRQIRRDYVYKLAKMREEHIAAHGNFCVKAYNVALDAIVTGDPEWIEQALQVIDFSKEKPDLRDRYTPAFAPFIELCKEARVALQNEVEILARILEGDDRSDAS